MWKSCTMWYLSENCLHCTVVVRPEFPSTDEQRNGVPCVLKCLYITFCSVEHRKKGAQSFVMFCICRRHSSIEFWVALTRGTPSSTIVKGIVAEILTLSAGWWLCPISSEQWSSMAIDGKSKWRAVCWCQHSPLEGRPTWALKLVLLGKNAKLLIQPFLVLFRAHLVYPQIQPHYSSSPLSCGFIRIKNVKVSYSTGRGFISDGSGEKPAVILQESL